ncbi:unnamed protein product, partial [Mesorhabditis spiculigera]
MVTFGGVIACYLYHIYVQHLPAGTLMATFSQYGRSSDFVMALVKAAIFGLASTSVATFKGLHAKAAPAALRRRSQRGRRHCVRARLPS